jgi:hypothetical protein
MEKKRERKKERKRVRTLRSDAFEQIKHDLLSKLKINSNRFAGLRKCLNVVLHF